MVGGGGPGCGAGDNISIPPELETDRWPGGGATAAVVRWFPYGYVARMETAIVEDENNLYDWGIENRLGQAG